MDDGHWILLSRDYKPLGGDPMEFYDYDEMPEILRIKSVPPTKAKKLSHDGSGVKDGMIYLYSDGCIPTSNAKNMAAYLEKIAVLMKMKTVGDS